MSHYLWGLLFVVMCLGGPAKAHPVFYADTILPAMDPIDLAESCQAQIVAFEPNTAENALQQKHSALKRDEAPVQGNVGRLFSNEVRLTCGEGLVHRSVQLRCSARCFCHWMLCRDHDGFRDRRVQLERCHLWRRRSEVGRSLGAGSPSRAS